MTQLFTSALSAIRLSDDCNNAKRCRKPSVFAFQGYFFLSGFSHLNSENSAIDIATSIVLAGSKYLPSVKMGRKRKSRGLSRPGKRRFSGNQFCSTTRVSSHSQAESSAEKEQPLTSGDATSASAYKLNIRSFSASAADAESPETDSESSETDYTFSSDDTDYSDGDSSELGCSSDDSDESTLCGFRLVDKGCLARLTDTCRCRCSLCGDGELHLFEQKRLELASELGLECSHCGARESQVMSERRGQALDVNRRAVLASRVVGFGREGLTKFCGLMNMPVPALSKDAFQNNQRAVLTVTVAQRSLNKAAADLRSVQEEQGCDVPGDCAVT